MDKFRTKYRIPSARAQWWDYGRDAAYYITICTKDRRSYFGDVLNGEMQWSEIGNLANNLWMEIPRQFPWAESGDFVVMPNHVHGIVVINKRVVPVVETRLIASLQPIQQPDQQEPQPPTPGGITGHHNPMLHENLSRIIRWYKGRVAFDPEKFMQIFPGNPGFMIILFAMIQNISVLPIISKIILQNGRMTDSINNSVINSMPGISIIT